VRTLSDLQAFSEGTVGWAVTASPWPSGTEARCPLGGAPSFAEKTATGSSCSCTPPSAWPTRSPAGSRH